ncbi:MAG: phosphoribosylformylglycinamidine synthase I [Candidatus Omnitrophica bacterium]|nr:phosphoribosylformylglycinamidine synthase I [Candidatus Omnitrophota bacterium]
MNDSPAVLILRTAGTNCEKETAAALSAAGAAPRVMHLHAFKKDPSLSRYQMICFPGGFSYGDDLGAGKIFSLELMLWFRRELERFIQNGRLVLGICNGFQILANTGILPDADFRQKFTLAENKSARFEDRWVHLTCPAEAAGREIWCRGMPRVIDLPVAHGEGRVYADGPVTERLRERGQILFHYCDRNGSSAAYPLNPNGSLAAVAGITDPSGRILGLMPHPERGAFAHHYPGWQNEPKIPWGMQLFRNAVQYLQQVNCT